MPSFLPERHDGQQHAYPLPHIETLAKEQQRTYQHHHGPRGVDRPNDGQRQVFHAEIAKHPGREHDQGFQYDVLMHFPATAAHMEDAAVEHVSSAAHDDERQEDERREQRVEKQDGNHGIVLQCLFLQ